MERTETPAWSRKLPVNRNPCVVAGDDGAVSDFDTRDIDNSVERPRRAFEWNA
jgi:hypothetical protein